MKKEFLIFLFTLMILTTIFAQDVKVIKVLGEISYQQSGSMVKSGDEFHSKTTLDYKTPQSRAIVYNEDKGRYILSGGNNEGNIMLPGMNNLASRAGAILNEVDLKKFFSDDFLLMDSTFVQISSSAFPMDEENFFYLEFTHNKESVNKKFSFIADTLFMIRNTVFSLDGKSFQPELKTPVKLWYFNAQTEESQLISSFNLVSPDIKETLKEIVLIKNVITEDTNQESIQSEIISYLNDVYGRIDEEGIRIFLSSIKQNGN